MSASRNAAARAFVEGISNAAWTFQARLRDRTSWDTGLEGRQALHRLYNWFMSEAGQALASGVSGRALRFQDGRIMAVNTVSAPLRGAVAMAGAVLAEDPLGLRVVQDRSTRWVPQLRATRYTQQFVGSPAQIERFRQQAVALHQQTAGATDREDAAAAAARVQMQGAFERERRQLETAAEALKQLVFANNEYQRRRREYQRQFGSDRLPPEPERNVYAAATREADALLSAARARAGVSGLGLYAASVEGLGALNDPRYIISGTLAVGKNRAELSWSKSRRVPLAPRRLAKLALPPVPAQPMERGDEAPPPPSGTNGMGLYVRGIGRYELSPGTRPGSVRSVATDGVGRYITEGVRGLGRYITEGTAGLGRYIDVAAGPPGSDDDDGMSGCCR